MPVLNGGFEDAGPAPGLAAHWSVRSSVRARSIAGFGPGPERAWEDFERWHAAAELELGAVTLGVFEPRREAFEAFEAGWGNDLFAFELPEGLLTIATFGGEIAEAMTIGWSTAGFATEWGSVIDTVAFFDGEARERFERRWRDNERYRVTWDDAASTAARFGDTPVGTGVAWESFAAWAST